MFARTNIIAFSDPNDILSWAAPGEAHGGYDDDQRVIKLMVSGMSENKADPMVRQRCQWLEVR